MCANAAGWLPRLCLFQSSECHSNRPCDSLMNCSSFLCQSTCWLLCDSLCESWVTISKCLVWTACMGCQRYANMVLIKAKLPLI